MKVHPGHEAEYEHRHRPIWVALEDALRSHGVSRYSIFLDATTRDLPPSNTPSGRTRHIGSSRPASLGLGTVSQRCRGRQGSSGECAGRSADSLHDSALVGSQLAGDATPARRARETARTLVAAASRRERTDTEPGGIRNDYCHPHLRSWPPKVLNDPRPSREIHDIQNAWGNWRFAMHTTLKHLGGAQDLTEDRT
jgi:hypothetical protein